MFIIFRWQFFWFSFSAVQLHMEILAIIICQRLFLYNKEIILHLTKKKRNAFKKKKQVVGSNKVARTPTFCVLKFLTLSNNNWASPSVQIKFISGDSFNFTFFFGDIFYQLCLMNVSLCFFIKVSRRIKSNFSSRRQNN